MSWRRVSFCVQVECYDYDNDGSHDLIGLFETTMTRLKEASRSSPVRIFSLSRSAPTFSEPERSHLKKKKAKFKHVP